MAKKTLATLWLAWMLALSPKAEAEITPKTEETKKALIEAVTTEQTTPEKDGETIVFQEAQKLQEQQFFAEIMNDEDFQKLIDKYWQENVEKVMNEILQNKDIKRTIRKVLEDEKAQEALKNWNNKKIEKIIKQYINSEKTTIIYWSLAIISALLLIIYKKTQ